MSETPSKKREKKARSSSLYEYDYERSTVKLKNRKCPRCGATMAYHKAPVQRWTCGSCSYTDYVKSSKES